MRWQALILMCVAVGTTLAGEAGDANKKFLEAIQGEWKIVKMVKGGMDGPEDKIARTTMIIKGEQVSVREGDGEPKEHAKMVIDASKTPATLDIHPDGKAERVVLGIVMLEGDALKLCFTKPGGERPKTFASPVGSFESLMELKRISKK